MTRAALDPRDWNAARAICVREARRVLRDAHAAEDAAQEALVRAWRAQDRCRSLDDFAPWIRAIAWNEACRLARRRAQVRARESGDGGSSGAVVGAVEERLDALACDQLLALLPRAERELLRLRYVVDMSQPQIARRLDVPVGTIKVRLHRSREKLRTLLSNEGLGGRN